MRPKPANPGSVGATLPTPSLQEVPDLIVEPRATTAQAPPVSDAGLWTDSELDLFDEGPSAGVAELDFGLELEPLASGSSVALSAGSPLSEAVGPASSAQPRSFAGPAASSPVAPRSDLPWPLGTTPQTDQLAVDLDEVRRLAGFGEPPSSIFAAPPYALRVLLQRRRLRMREREAARELREAEKARDDVLVEVARKCRPELEANDRYGSLAREFAVHEGLVAEQRAALEEADAGLHAAEADIDAQLAVVDQERQGARAELEKRERELAELEARLARVTAQAKRLDIERRALLDVARRKLGPEGGELPPEVAGPLGELEARSAALAPELAEREREVTAGKARLREAQSGLDLLDAKRRRVAAQKTMQLAERTRERERRAEALREAEGAERAALVAVAQAVLAMKGHVAVDEARLEALRQLDARVARAAYAVECVRLALLGYDGSAVRNGYVLTALLLIVLIGVVLLR